MNEEELPINKNYKELKQNKKTSIDYFFSRYMTYLIHLLTFSRHNPVQKMIYDCVHHDHHEDQGPAKIIKNFVFYFLEKIYTKGIKWNIVSPKSVPTASAVNRVSTY
jgi:hypothetical protein